MSGHTPGPWRINPNWLPSEYPDWREIISGHDKNYHRMSVSGHCGEANARLIAAAPELLEALRGALSYLSLYGPSAQPALLSARAAIAKSTGTSTP